MTPEQEFLHCYRRLGELLALRSAGGLRELICVVNCLTSGGAGLIKTVARIHRIGVVISAPRSSPETVAAFETASSSVEVSLCEGQLFDSHTAVKLGIDEFLRYPVSYHQGRHFTVGEIVLACGEIGELQSAGGGNAPGIEATLRQLNQASLRRGGGSVFSLLHRIAAALYGGLASLAGVVQQELEERVQGSAPIS